MKIIQVVTLFTPDGAFGGPTRVALNQTRELRARGHDVTLAGSALGYGRALPTVVAGVPVKLFHARRAIPASGFAGLTSPGLLRWFRGSAGAADVVHVHVARDLITLPAAAWASLRGIRYVLQPHGMVDAPSNRMASMLDALVTRRVLRRAPLVLCLSDAEERDVVQVAERNLTTAILPNGVPYHAQVSSGTVLDVLFLARMHPRKRPSTFVAAALSLRAEFPSVHFSLVGPDEGEINGIIRTLAACGSPAGIDWEGALDPGLTMKRMAHSQIYVLPAVNEPFGMTVIEAMSVGKPVIVTTTCALAGLVRATNSGIVVDDTTESLASAIRKLLHDDDLRESMGRNALRAVRETYGMHVVSRRLESIYEEVRVA